MTTPPTKAALRARLRRISQGRAARTAEAAALRQPRQSELLVPILDELRAAGGAARPRDIYEAVADRLDVPQEARQLRAKFANDRVYNLWERQVRWARQTAVARGYIAADRRGIWQITDAGRSALGNVRRGIIITFFDTDAGICLAMNAEDASAVVERGSIQALISSPPFPLNTQKAYGGLRDTATWLRWMTELAEGWKDLLAPTGSLILQLGDAYYRGSPTLSPYIERLTLALIDDLGYHLAGRLYWENPNACAPMEWVAVRRVRVRPSTTPVLWFSKNEHCKANNRNVLKPYAESTIKRTLGRPSAPTKRPSGYDMGHWSWARDNGGAIPGNLIRASNTSSNDRYRRLSRAHGLPLHPATMPGELANFLIRLTTDPGDIVMDPFFGSGTTGEQAEILGRRFIGIERSLAYLTGAAFRFDNSPGFKFHGPRWSPVAA